MALEDLDRLPWTALSHGLGSAEDIPPLMRRCAYPAGEVRREALREILRRVTAGGVSWSATPEVVPFLIELLQTPRVGDKDWILTMLGSMARCSMRNQEDGKEIPDAAIESSWLLETRVRIDSGSAVYIPFLDHVDSACRIAAAYVLSECLRDPAPVAQALRSRLKTESGDIGRAALLFALHAVGDLMDGPLFREVLSSDQGYLARWAAAAGLVLQWEHQAEPEALDVLVRLISTSGPARSLYPSFPWGTGDLNRDTAEILGRASPKAAEAIVPHLIASFSTASVRSSLTIAFAILRLTFPKPVAETDASKLTGLQRQVLGVFAASHRLGEHSPLRKLLNAKGLPSDRASLAQWTQ